MPFLFLGTICNTEQGPDQGFCEDINECLPGWEDPRGLVTVDGRTDIDGVSDDNDNDNDNENFLEFLLRGRGSVY